MPKSIPAHIDGLLRYLSRPNETANEDRAITYFRTVYGDAFTKDAKRSDGYVAGLFVLELKGKTNAWLSGLFQGLAYKRELDFSQVIVAAKDFLGVWRVSDLPEEIRHDILSSGGAASSIGTKFAARYRNKRNALLKLATWHGDELSGSLFLSNPQIVLEKFASFEKTIRAGEKVRQKVTLKNFTAVLKEMKAYFDPKQPVKAVRAFYSMVYGWNDASTLQLSGKVNHQATLAGEIITDLIPAKRMKFKEYVEDRRIHLAPNENRDDFFARYDEALDAVDKNFRKKHGIFFTDRELSKFVMWLVKQHIPNLGKNYLVIDPACGSGNLVTNWRSPLELRHKVVSEIEPELLYAVQKRMQGDQWHDGKFTVVPKVSENKGLNFLDKSADEYLEQLRKYLAEKGHKPDKPLAFLCNPPYRSDEDQSAEGVDYKIHQSIIALTGADASSERYCCFLAQMKLICEAARSSGLPDNSYLLLFTKSSWLTKRAVFAEIRANMLEAFDDVAGILVDGSEFFDVKGRWPVAFTVWKYRARGKKGISNRSVPLFDLTQLTRNQLLAIPWDDAQKLDRACDLILRESEQVLIGEDRVSIREWSRETMTDFKRDRRISERNQKIVGGLPANDSRHALKKAHGEADGPFIGFMDDLTPCRVKTSIASRPWFRLNNQFMDIKKNRCLSGPPTNRGYCARDLESAKKLFFWYAIARTFLQHPYPMWADADDMWAPEIPRKYENRVFETAFAIGYAENECVETRFPANNPTTGLPELAISNPLSPLDRQSFWSVTMRPYCADATSNVRALVNAVDGVFETWRRCFKGDTELPISRKPYLLDDRGLTLRSGICQIRAYAKEAEDLALTTALTRVQGLLKDVKTEFFGLLTSAQGLAYFGPGKRNAMRVTTANETSRKRIGG
jgi:hypothetical protein